MAELIVGQQEFGRPFVAPPGTPKEQVKALQTAFMATMKDPELVAEAEKMRIGVNAKSGEDIAAIVHKMYEALARTDRPREEDAEALIVRLPSDPTRAIPKITPKVTAAADHPSEVARAKSLAMRGLCVYEPRRIRHDAGLRRARDARCGGIGV